MTTSNALFKTVDSLIGPPVIVAGRFLRNLWTRGRRAAFPHSPQRVLFCKFCCQGDALLTLPSLLAFRRSYPGTRMVAAVGKKTEAVYRGSGIFDHIEVLGVSGSRGGKEMLQSGFISFMRRLRKEGPYDAYVDMNLYFHFSAAMGLGIGAPVRVGFDCGNARHLAFTHPVYRDPEKHESDCYGDLFGAAKPANRGAQSFQFPFLEEARGRMRKELVSLGWEPSKPLVALFPGSNPNWPNKRWPLSRFREFLQSCRLRETCQFVVLGSRDESELGSALKQCHPGTIDLTGKTDFEQLAGTLSLCRLFVGNDSGPMHLADMLLVPVVAIFGPTDERKWGPRGMQARVVRNPDAECRPCYYLSRMPDCPTVHCLDDIPAEQVCSAALEIWETNQSSKPRENAG